MRIPSSFHDLNRRISARLVVARVCALVFTLSCAGASRDVLPLYRAEDARAATSADLEILLRALRSPDAETRVIALRATGRLQRSDLLDSLVPALGDSAEAVRIEAANAVAQIVQPGRDTAAVRRARAVLQARWNGATTPAERGVLARSLGRLPHESAAAAQETALAIASIVPDSDTVGCRVDVGPALDSLNAAQAYGIAHGIYSVARRARALPCRAVRHAAAAAAYGRSRVAGDSAVWTRELGVLALIAANRADSSVLAYVAADPDARVRRLAMRPHLTEGRLLVAVGDTAAMVRIDAVRALGQRRGADACRTLLDALRDPAPHVRFESVDAVAAACPPAVARAVLDSLVRLLPADTLAGDVSWHVPARALTALAPLDPLRARERLDTARSHPVWQVRAAAATAARHLSDTAAVLAALQDRDANVRETALTLAAQMGGAARTQAVRSGLSDSAYQVVLVAAQAAREVPEITVADLAQPLARLTARGEETSRDPRVELLRRIAERGGALDTMHLQPYVSDFDTLIARQAAELLSRWAGRDVPATARPVSRTETAPASAAQYLRITMSPASGGGSFLVRLFPAEAPATVARIVRLARAGYYDGRTFHRVVPNFVIQGGSPDANEYVGDGPYMRDELGLRSHTRGTLGVSTRGRDTGDAQMFVNLVDNFRLDHDYTVFGEVVAGMSLVDALQPGAVIQSIEVRRTP
jgi:cyclophilin family peptidyl-prolyl cis-trans isomerase/HEAT repeat protein